MRVFMNFLPFSGFPASHNLSLRKMQSKKHFELDEVLLNQYYLSTFLRDCLKQRRKNRARALMDDHFTKSRWVRTLSDASPKHEKGH
jgi:hypothetical protein